RFLDDDALAFGLVAGALDEVQFLPVAPGVVGLDGQLRLVADAVGLEPEPTEHFGAFFGHDRERGARMFLEEPADELWVIFHSAHGVRKGDRLGPAGKDRMAHRIEGDVTAVINEVIQAVLERGVRKGFPAMLLEESGEPFPFLLPAHLLVRQGSRDIRLRAAAPHLHSCGRAVEVHAKFSKAQSVVRANTFSLWRSRWPTCPLPGMMCSAFLHISAEYSIRAVSGGSRLSSSPHSTRVGMVILETRWRVLTKKDCAAPGNGKAK